MSAPSRCRHGTFSYPKCIHRWQGAAHWTLYRKGAFRANSHRYGWSFDHACGILGLVQQLGIWRYTMIIKIVTISLMAVFYICYFAKLISQKKQGIKTDQLGKGKEGFVKFIEVALKIITYLLPVIQIISIVFYSGTAHIVLQFTGVVITMFGVLAYCFCYTDEGELASRCAKRRKDQFGNNGNLFY